MIKAVVGANWGDEGKGKITDMLAREVLTQAIPSSMIMVNLRFTHFRQVYFITTPQALSATVWL